MLFRMFFAPKSVSIPPAARLGDTALNPLMLLATARG